MPLSIVEFLPFAPAAIAWFIAMVALLCVSALMSGSETALFSLSPAQQNEVKKGHSGSDRAILALLGDPDYLLATILIVNNLVNICIILLANKIIDLLVLFGSGGWEFVVKTVIVTFVLLLFGEIMPKVYSAYNPLGFARLVSRLLVGLRWFFRPFAWVLIHSGGSVSRLLSKKREGLSIDELSSAMDITRGQNDQERQMLSGIVNFVGTEVAQVMKPRVDIVAIDIEAPYSELKELVIRSGYSRIPVWEESIDRIRGILYVKDVIGHIDKGDDFQWQTLLRKPYFVPEHKKINDLLEEFRASRVHIAIVVDEYGSTVGLVSLEDILEEIVGEITDESDQQELVGYTKLDERTFDFDGSVHLNDMLRAIGRPDDFFDDERGESETIAGLMLEVKRDFLKNGEMLTIKQIRFTVKAIEGRRIERVRVKLPLG